MAQSESGASPYSTGGGGVTFERKVAVNYLARLLVGDGAVELGDGRVIVRVDFQQAPEFTVDDLVIRASRPNEAEPSLVLAVAVRRAPNIVASDEPTRKLVSAFIGQIIDSPASEVDTGLALVVAGPQDHAQQLSELAALAATQASASNLFALVHTPGRFRSDIRGRLNQWEALVRLALVDLGVQDPSTELVQNRAWRVLARLTVLMPRLEAPDETDWVELANELIGIARNDDLESALDLRNQLVALAEDYPPRAATIDERLLRRAVHRHLDSSKRRHQQGWQALQHLQASAVASVRDHIGVAGDRTARIDRSDAEEDLREAVAHSNAVVLHGDSGVGKSALAVHSMIKLAQRSPQEVQTVAINLRSLPETTLALENYLGAPLATLLGELSAPVRVLVVDGADAAAEDKLHQLRYLIDAGRTSGVVLVAVGTSETKRLLHDTIAEARIADIAEFQVQPLDDAQIDTLITTFPELTALAANTRSRELLRRPVVFELLVRGELQGVPLSDADAMMQIWSGLVRRGGRSDRGTPDARELALLRLAELSLTGGDALNGVMTIDPLALEGLRHDGLLRSPIDDPFQIGPEFSHDEVRRYALARLMLASTSVTSRLVDAGVPRWALGAARLACQVRLAADDSVTNPVRERLSRVQQSFDAIAESGHGARWGDVPGEALLTLGDPGTVLRDAWPGLRADGDAGLRRISRLVVQRLVDGSGLVRLSAIEPVIDLLLSSEEPWSAGEYAQTLLRKWLHALVVSRAPEGHPLRLRLLERLLSTCATADARQKREQAAADATRAARSPEQVEEDSKAEERHQALIKAMGGQRRSRRTRRELPRAVTDEIIVELLALLGPDLGQDGEALLRRIAQEAPAYLWPAVEKPYTDFALAQFGRALLSDLTEAYYIQDDGWGSRYDFGIRNHRATAYIPQAAWYYGPFAILFRTDFVRGVAALNRMLNHAARVRAGVLSGGGDHFDPVVVDDQDDEYRTELEVTGVRRDYVGDAHVWMWYRGGGIGPRPCMSALLALERVCDEFLASGAPLENLVTILLTSCDNLATVALTVGLLVRHLEAANSLLDPFLTEPAVWEHEFARVDHEKVGPVASSEGVAAPDRRLWSLADVGMRLVISAEGARIDELREIGQKLISRARKRAELRHGGSAESQIEDGLALVRAWASGLDQSTYSLHETEQGVYVQSAPPQEVVDIIQRNAADAQQFLAAAKLKVKYYIDPRHGNEHNPTAEDLAADIDIARNLLDHPPNLRLGDEWDSPALVAAAAIEANLLKSIQLPSSAIEFAVRTVMRIAAGEAYSPQYDSVESYFEQGAERSAARVMPLLLLPAAQSMRTSLGAASDETRVYSDIIAGSTNLASALANEVRVHLARGLDAVWTTDCSADGPCHHQAAFELVTTTMRDCAFGDWNDEAGSRELTLLDNPVDEALANVEDESIFVARLDAAIRALAPASTTTTCISQRAQTLLNVVIEAHRRGQLAHEENYDERGTHAMQVARALLTVIAEGEESPLLEHLETLADNSSLLKNLLTAVSAAAEECPNRAATARRIWPSVVARVLTLHRDGHNTFNDRYDGDLALAALMPNRTYEHAFLYREIQTEPIMWWTPREWQQTVEDWLPLARGNTTCIDQLVNFLKPMHLEERVRTGLPWLADLVLAQPDKVAKRTYLLVDWLIETQSVARDHNILDLWQQVVDALVVAGETRLAPYSV